MLQDEKAKEIQESLKGFLETFKVLQEDVVEALNQLLKDPSNFWLRTHIRAFFALVEGTTFGLKQVALKVHEYRPCFTEAEVSLLKEVSYELSEQGKVQIRPKYLDTLSNVRFTFEAVKKAFDLEFEITYNDSGWQCFRESLQIRHQVTHPKTASGLAISQLDDGRGKNVDIITEALGWYVQQVMDKLFPEMMSAIKKMWQ